MCVGVSIIEFNVRLNGLFQSMINLGYISRGFTLTQMKSGLNLPCDIDVFEIVESEKNLDRISNRAFVRDEVMFIS